MTIHTAPKVEVQHPPLARDPLGNLLALPEGTCSWRVCRETSGRPRELRGPDKQPIRFPLDTTSDELAELCGAGVYRVYALDEVGTQLADEHVAKWDLTPGSRELRNGTTDAPLLASLRPSAPATTVTDLRYALEAMTQMMKTNSDALRVVTDAHVDLAKSLATAKGLPRNGAFVMPPMVEQDEDDDEPEERSPHVLELLMPFATKLAEIVPGLVMGKALLGGASGSKALAPASGAPPDEDDLASRPAWEARDLIDLRYASRKAEAKRAAKAQQPSRADGIAAVQARVMRDPVLVQQLVAIKGQLAPDEVETLMSAVGFMSESEQTTFLDSIKSLPVDAAVEFCRDIARAIRELSTANAKPKA